MEQHRKTIRGYLILGRKKETGWLTPVIVKTSLKDAFDLGHLMLEGKEGMALKKEGINVMIKPIDIEYYEEDLCPQIKT